MSYTRTEYLYYDGRRSGYILLHVLSARDEDDKALSEARRGMFQRQLVSNCLINIIGSQDLRQSYVVGRTNIPSHFHGSLVIG